MLPRRSAPSVPGALQKMLPKPAGPPADEIVIDFEDGVAADAKDSARAMGAALLREGLDATAAVAVRVNAVDSEWCQADVRELVDQAASAVGSLVVPKVEQAKDL